MSIELSASAADPARQAAAGARAVLILRQADAAVATRAYVVAHARDLDGAATPVGTFGILTARQFQPRSKPSLRPSPRLAVTL